MAIRNSVPLKWQCRGLSGARDGTNSFPGAMKTLRDLIPDPSTRAVWVPRPAAIELIDFTAAGAPVPAGSKELSGMLVVGDLLYGLIPSTLNAGFDEPFCYDLANNVFLTVSGITSGNVPATPPASGDWTPPILAQIASRVLVCHPGFPGGDVKFGWFDVSSGSFVVVGDTNTDRYIRGNPELLGIQPGMAVSGTGIAANTSVASTDPRWWAIDFVGDSHSSTVIDGIASTANLVPTLSISGPGIANGTTIVSRAANSVTLSQSMSETGAAVTFSVRGNLAITGDTHSNTTIDNLSFPNITDSMTLQVGQGITGPGILPDTTITAVAGTTITISQAATATAAGVTFGIIGATIRLSANTTATNDSIDFTVVGGTRLAPQWGAGDADRNPLPYVPLGVAQMNARAWFADGLGGIPFSDSGFPCRISNNPNVQALTTNDGLEVTAIAPLVLGVPLTGGTVQALIVFQGAEKMQQITGDQATGNLAINALPYATGTLAPLSIEPCGSPWGTSFISPQGLRFVKFDGSVTDPVGIDGMGITDPFQFAIFPSQICAAANQNVLRITVQNDQKAHNPFEEYWFDLARQTWTSGPNRFPASRLIQPWRTTFLICPVTAPRSVWRSDSIASHSSSYVENGAQMTWEYETVLLPDNDQMAMNAMVEANLSLAAASVVMQVLALDEQGNIIDALTFTTTGGIDQLRERLLSWNIPIIFKQMSLRVSGASDFTVRLGNFYMRYEILGYNNQALDETLFLGSDDAVFVLTNDAESIPLTPR